jgi:hypothetical protein
MKKTVLISEDTAKVMYQTASPELKKDLEDTFGKNLFYKNVMDRVKTFDDACREIGTTEKEFNQKFGCIGLDKNDIVFKKLKIIIKVLNEGWEPDWDNTNQRKWYPWFNMQSGGFGFSLTNFDVWTTHSYFGSLLCFKSQELCEYAATQFKSEYADYMINK